MDKRFEGRVALVTGGSRGIGRAVSIELARQGAHVYVNYQSGEAAALETVGLCTELGGKAEAIQFNVSHREEVDAAIASIQEKGGPIGILINNAGISRDGLFVRLKDEDWNATLETNLDGAFYCSRAVARSMMKSRYGRIVNMSSVVGQMGNVGQAAYVASKAAVIGLTKALGKELASRNITVNAVAPGFIETDMTRALDEKVREEHMKMIPAGRYGSPEEVASLVAFLCSDSAGYITGQVIGMNGGMYM